MFGKGVIEIILYLKKMEKAGYYELYKQGFVISRQAFSNVLKIIEKHGIADRKMIEGRPPRVEYSLTGKGKEIATALTHLEEILSGSLAR
jgi:DNA-binding HxlR family transcriptional regulator